MKQLRVKAPHSSSQQRGGSRRGRADAQCSVWRTLSYDNIRQVQSRPIDALATGSPSAPPNPLEPRNLHHTTLHCTGLLYTTPRYPCHATLRYATLCYTALLYATTRHGTTLHNTGHITIPDAKLHQVLHSTIHSTPLHFTYHITNTTVRSQD